jgi:hypothetical protein
LFLVVGAMAMLLALHFLRSSRSRA